MLDLALLIAFLALMEPGQASGYKWHEWIGLAFIPLFTIHLLLSWTWITAALRRVRTETDARARINFLLNASLFVMMLVLIVSGLVISDYVLPSAGLHTGGSRRWQQLHNMMSSLIVPVVGLHVALNWTWIRKAFRRYCVAPFRRRPIEPEP